MSVFTPVSEQQLIDHLSHYSVGKLLAYQGIAAGVENSNFFVTTDQGEFVLTLFEAHGVKKIHFYLGLMEHLNTAGIPTTKPVPAKQGEQIRELNARPAVFIERINGANPDTITATHCEQIAAMLGRFHLATTCYPETMPNEFDHDWQLACAQTLLPKLSAADATLLQSELAYQSDMQKQMLALPTGIIHGDLFRDNTLFIERQKQPELSAILDLYTACNDVLLMDLAIVLNDWCFQGNGQIDALLASALIKSYQAIRPLLETEKALFNAVLRAAALRFWILRLDLKYNPRARYGELSGNDYNPDEYRQKLLTHISQNCEIII